MSGQLRAEVAAVARGLAADGLLIGTAGNVSAVAPDGTVAITASGAILADCGPEQVVVVDRAGALVAGDLEPSSELELHLAAIDAGAGAVAHTHSPAATAVACARDDLPVIHYQQLLLGGAIRVAPYATFGTPELAAGVMAALSGRSAALMANHGGVAIGAALAKAAENARLLEWCCRLYLDASRLGPPRELDEGQQAAVIEAALRRNYGQPQPATAGQESR